VNENRPLVGFSDLKLTGASGRTDVFGQQAWDRVFRRVGGDEPFMLGEHGLLRRLQRIPLPKAA
jgi:hypothetical protein